jgi:hypothetical protein
MLSTRTLTVRCKAAATESSIPLQNKIFPLLNSPGVQKRNVSIKENINKLILIGTAEFKEINDLANELDLAHKKAFNFKTEEKVVVIDEENIFID